jgi:hypothetical protein
MPRAVAIPIGARPLEIRAPTAAGYCDEPCVEAVPQIYSEPTRAIGSLPKWARLLFQIFVRGGA